MAVNQIFLRVPTFSGVWYGRLGGPKGGGYGPDRPRLALPYPKQVFQEAGGYGLEVGWPGHHTLLEEWLGKLWRTRSRREYN